MTRTSPASGRTSVTVSFMMMRGAPMPGQSSSGMMGSPGRITPPTSIGVASTFCDFAPSILTPSSIAWNVAADFASDRWKLPVSLCHWADEPTRRHGANEIAGAGRAVVGRRASGVGSSRGTVASG